MLCQKCENNLEEGVKFCSKCGHPVNGLENESRVDDMILPASTLRRLSNHIIDTAVSYILLVGFTLLGLSFSDRGAGVMAIIGIVLFFGYHLISESIWQRTIGKLFTKTKVVDRNGNKPSFLKILGRSFARYIPFEPFSFLFGGHPIGWHDSLSKTLVVPVELSPAEVRGMDFDKIKNLKSNNAAAIIVTIVIVVLVMIAIIGILSSVVLASLTNARTKAKDANVKASMAELNVRAIVYQESNGSYLGFCKVQEVIDSLESASKASSIDQIKSNFVCNDDSSSWAASAPLSSPGYWCVDQSGEARTVESELSTETSCADPFTTNKVNN